jgi:hypothetical protein
MLAAHRSTYLVGARMVLGSEQGSDDCEPLGCDGNPTLTTSRDKLAESLNRVFLTPTSINQPEFPHERILGEYQHSNDQQPRRKKKRLKGRMVRKLSRYPFLSATEH